MFKRLRYCWIGVLMMAGGTLVYYFLANPVYQRKLVQKAEEARESLHNDKRLRWSGTVVVVGAADGDKLVVDTESSRKVKVSLAGIDAPELAFDRFHRDQELAEESREYLAQLTTNKAAQMEILGTDAAMRPLVLLKVDGVLVNEEMVKAGLAEFSREGAENMPAKVRHEIENAEIDARQKRLGIWGLANYVRPVEYRIRQNQERPWNR